MSNLIKWENRIKEKRQKITFNDFIKEIASWYPLILNKNNWFISRYPKSDRVKWVLKYVDFEHTRDSLISKWVEYDFSLSFFENYKVLFKSIDLPSLIIYAGNENAWFSDIVLWSKNIYLSSAIIQGCENILYSFNVKENSVNILNSINVIDSCENVYLSVWVIKWFNIFYSRYIFNSNNVWFSRNLIWCSECIFCENLENKSYCINNVELEKEEYFKKKEWILSKKKEFLDWYKKWSINWINIWNQNVSWNFIFYSENIENWYFAYQIKNWRNILMWWGTKNNENVYDVFTGWSIWNQDLYAVTSAGANSSKLYCCAHISFSSNLYYSYFLESCSFCIGCIWLKNKSYCILNKQYSQDEWNILTDKIFAQMEIDWVLWNYFPADMNPFYFNDTMASIVWNFSKEEIIKDGYMWRDEEVKVDIPEWSEVIDIKDLDIVNYDESILKKVIKDDSWNYYRIVKMEYDFLKKYNLPLPEIHWLDRIKLGFNF
ncbi:MAG: hypothetical protein ACD_4C00189G0002 [uncultured bacterium (gcode 4)]|uniref:Uncharacterized protein n=1 Tax=uncultured bacterium (gcode 4) TaxID=1234023 RepID=K2F6J5_9BACT|nr:MAG: hypothetical protein ACD_4C00189G0002 [uncultured bacterium (gcode 4)]